MEIVDGPIRGDRDWHCLSQPSPSLRKHSAVSSAQVWFSSASVQPDPAQFAPSMIISLANEARGQSSPMAIRVHSTRSIAASKALWSGVSLHDVCYAVGRTSMHTYVWFYNMDLDSTPGFQELMSQQC